MSRKKSILFICASAMLVLCLMIVTSALAASKERVLYSFCAQQLCPDGSNPVSSLVFDKAGNLYGTAVYGGNSNCVHGCGTVFELERANGKWTYKELHHFENNGEDGYYPSGNLIFDAKGNLYGTTALGGESQGGTVFELMPAEDGKWKEKILYSFSDQAQPLAAVTLDSTGSLYGTTFYGGSFDDGMAFQLSAGKDGHWTEKLLHSFDFNEQDGFSSRASVVFDKSGNFYGTTVLGGAHGNGTVFEEKRGKNDSWTESVRYSFTGGSDGALANAPLVFDSSGNLYSTTLAGGSDGVGNVFELKNIKGEWELTNLFSFENLAGTYPEGGVIFDKAGHLYGTTYQGGVYDNAGTVFKLTLEGDTWKETLLHSFISNGIDGYNPEAGLIMDKAGNLYGTTNAGGAYGYGTVFEVTP